MEQLLYFATEFFAKLIETTYNSWQCESSIINLVEARWLDGFETIPLNFLPRDSTVTMPLLLFLLALSVLIAWIGASLVERHARKLRLIQLPNHRSSHETPTANGGGIGIVVAGTLSGIWLVLENGHVLGWPLVGYSLLIAFVGLMDDRHFLLARVRLTVHLLVCVLLLVVLDRIPTIELPFGILLDGTLLMLVLVLAGAWWINLFNFMDGIDAIAASQAIFMLTAPALLAYWWHPEVINNTAWLWMLCLAAASAGFLLLNWPPARIFMGDVGSTYLALMIFALALISVRDGWLAYTPWLVFGALFISDATLTLLIRMIRGEVWYEAHNSHAYQVLSRHWQSHQKVTLLCIAINLLWLTPLAWACLWIEEWRWGFVTLAYAPLLAGCYWIRRLQRDS